MSSTILANIGTLLKSMDKYGHVEPHISESFRDPYPKFNDLVPYCIIQVKSRVCDSRYLLITTYFLIQDTFLPFFNVFSTCEAIDGSVIPSNYTICKKYIIFDSLVSSSITKIAMFNGNPFLFQIYIIVEILRQSHRPSLPCLLKDLPSSSWIFPWSQILNTFFHFLPHGEIISQLC